MTEQAPDKVWSGIDIPKTIAGALAAVCAAVIGSFLGVAGTLIGAAVASIIGSVGTEIYARSIRHGRKKLETLAPTFIKAPAAVGTPEVAAATEEDSPSHTAPPPRRQIRWARVAMIAGALFVLAMGSLTIAELVTGKSVASTVGNSTKATTTFGGLFDSGTSSSDSTPTTTPSATPTPTDTATGNDPGVAPTTQAPADGGTQTTTQPTTEPTIAPTTGAPQEDPTTGGQDSTGQGGQDSTGQQDTTGQNAPNQ
jgi:hypothetical protein